MVTGLLLIISAALAALKVPVEVIGGFNVDGLAMLTMGMGALLVIRGLLGTGPVIEHDVAASGDSSLAPSP